jgi:drug/metabolite transporter (DMT)-like permease
MLGCAVLFLALRVAAGGAPPALRPLLHAAGLMALVATAAPLALLMLGMRRLGAARTAVVGAAEPVFTAGLLALTLGERVSASQGLGILAIVAGVTLVSHGAERKAARPDCP